MRICSHDRGPRTETGPWRHERLLALVCPALLATGALCGVPRAALAWAVDLAAPSVDAPPGALAADRSVPSRGDRFRAEARARAVVAAKALGTLELEDAFEEPLRLPGSRRSLDAPSTTATGFAAAPRAVIGFKGGGNLELAAGADFEVTFKARDHARHAPGRARGPRGGRFDVGPEPDGWGKRRHGSETARGRREVRLAATAEPERFATGDWNSLARKT